MRTKALNFDWMVGELKRLGWQQYNQSRNPDQSIAYLWLWWPPRPFASLTDGDVILELRPGHFQVNYSARNIRAPWQHYKWFSDIANKKNIENSVVIAADLHRIANNLPQLQVETAARLLADLQKMYGVEPGSGSDPFYEFDDDNKPTSKIWETVQKFLNGEIPR
jgi:hypothetical protein